MMLQNGDNLDPTGLKTGRRTPTGVSASSLTPLAHLLRVLKRVEEALPDSETLAGRINRIRLELTDLIGLLAHDYASEAHAHRSDLTDGRAILRDVVAWANVVLRRTAEAAGMAIEIDLDPALELLPATASIGAMLHRIETALHRIRRPGFGRVHLRIERSDLNVNLTMSSTTPEVLDLMTTCLEEDGVLPIHGDQADHLPKWCLLVQALGGSVVLDYSGDNKNTHVLRVVYPIAHGIGLADLMPNVVDGTRLNAA